MTPPDYVQFEATALEVARTRERVDADFLSVELDERWKLIHLLANMFREGMIYEQSLAATDRPDIIAPMAAYNAGYQQAVKDIGELGESHE